MIGELAALAAAIGWAFSSVSYRKALSKASLFQANAIRSISAGALLFVICTVLGKTGNLVDLPLSVALAAGLSGVISLVLADTLYMCSLKHLGVSIAVPSARFFYERQPFQPGREPWRKCYPYVHLNI